MGEDISVSLPDAVQLWLKYRCDNILSLLLSGAATKSAAKEALDRLTKTKGNLPKRKSSFRGTYKCFFSSKRYETDEPKAKKQRQRCNPIRRRAFHGNYRESLGSSSSSSISKKSFRLRKA